LPNTTIETNTPTVFQADKHSSKAPNGVRIQVYVALIASLLVSLWVGRPPTKRTYEMLCFYLSGWASEAEVIAHLNQLHRRDPPPCKS
jgi:hypothetical protein